MVFLVDPSQQATSYKSPHVFSSFFEMLRIDLRERWVGGQPPKTIQSGKTARASHFDSMFKLEKKEEEIELELSFFNLFF